MNINDYLSIDSICVGLAAIEKNRIHELLTALLQKDGATSRYRTLGKEVEEKGTLPVIGGGVAILQIRSAFMKRSAISAITLKRGIFFDGEDGTPTRLFFLVALSETEQEELASGLSVILLNEDLRDQLIDAANEETFLKLLQMAREGIYGKEQKKESLLVLALLDIKNEHAVEAAAVLQQKAASLGMVLRVAYYEKGDPASLFDLQDLQEASGVLLMCGVCPDCFDGKPVLRAGVTDGIYRPEHLLNTVAKAPVFHKRPKKFNWTFFIKRNKNSH